MKFAKLIDAERVRKPISISALFLTGFACALLVLAAAWCRPALFASRVEPIAVHVGADPDSIRHISELREDVDLITRRIATDEQLVRDYRMQLVALADSKADATAPRQTERKSHHHPRTNTKKVADDLQNKVNELKELSQYAHDVARTIGALDTALSDQQVLKKRAAELDQKISAR